MRTPDQIVGAVYSEYSMAEIEMIEAVRNEVVAEIKEHLWRAGCDTTKVAEAMMTFRKENPRWSNNRHLKSLPAPAGAAA